MRKKRIVPGGDGWKGRRSLFLLLAALALMAAVWSWLAFAAPKQQTLDQRVKNVASQLRCPVCQGESVAESPAPLAQQMRQVIREQVQAGRSDEAIVQYFADRYGEQNVVWSPPRQGFALLAWIAPIVLLLGGLVLLFFVARDWQAGSGSPPGLLSSSKMKNPEWNDANNEDRGPVDAELEQYRAQIEHELAADDPLFRSYKTEAK
ncbi:MAG: cytochrome c-type biogenesis protein CcmH [Ktedonobacteraceae bacterium]|nr:cytochrome c-type biogenesis protein CcmH [Ktedonobacteraceae bacterium]